LTFIGVHLLCFLIYNIKFCTTFFHVQHFWSTPSPSVLVLLFGLPLLGLICCGTVGLAIRAAESVVKHLLDQRDLLSISITEKANSITEKAKYSLRDNKEAKSLAKISKIGFNREQKWTLSRGALPHLLPWVFAILWSVLWVSLFLP
jgi:hypothetical protein